MNTDIALALAVSLVAVVTLGRISNAASVLSRNNGEIHHRISVWMYCTCAEILLATVSIFFLRYVWVWAVLKITGRLIELYGIEAFQRYLYKTTGKDTPTEGGSSSRGTDTPKQ